MTKPKNPEPNPIEEAIGGRAKETPLDPKTKLVHDIVTSGPILTPVLEQIQDEPSPSEMLTLEELNRQTEEKLNPRLTEEECLQQTVTPTITTGKGTLIPVPKPPKKTIEDTLAETIPVPVLKSDPQPATGHCSQESPPQKIDSEFHPIGEQISGIEKLPKNFKTKHTYETGIAGATPNENAIDELDALVKQEIPDVGGVLKDDLDDTRKTPSAEEQIQDSFRRGELYADAKALEALRNHIMDTGFVASGVAFHIRALCSQPMTTPTTTSWDFKDRAMIPEMVFALLRQPGYIEGIWPSLKVVMADNKGNAVWTAGIATTIAFFDVIRTLPALKEMQNEETEKKS